MRATKLFARCAIACGTIALSTIALNTNSSVTYADDGSSIIVRDASGAVVDRTIIAGVLIGQEDTTGESDSCEWTVSVPRDSGQGPGTEVTREVGSVTYRLYDRACSDGDTTYHWIPEISTETVARQAASVAYDLIPAPFGDFAPPAREGIINIGTWFWVQPAVWQPKSVTAWVPTPQGSIIVTTTATPTQLVFQPGDGLLGIGKKICVGPGWRWTQMMGDLAPSPCMYTYRHSSAMLYGGLFSATLSIVWQVTWRSNVGTSGRLSNVTTSSLHQMRIREFQALITS